MNEKNKPERPIVFWDCNPNSEILDHKEKNAAIGAHLDKIAPEKWPETITVEGFAHMIAPKPTMDDAVELVDNWFEMNWEELQGEDAPDTPNSTVEAALTFLTKLHQDFVPWACESITSEEIDVEAWILENRPDWVTE